MQWLKQNLLFACVLFGCAAGLGLEGWWLPRERRGLGQARLGLREKLDERDRLRRQSAEWTADRDAALAAERAEVEEAVQELQDELAPFGIVEQVGRTPATPTAAYFELAAFVAEMRARADEAHVAIGADERFGFASYASEGPERPLIDGVARQQRVVGYLLGILFDAGPRTLVGVQRVHPRPQPGLRGHGVVGSSEGGTPKAAPRKSAAVADFFEFPFIPSLPDPRPAKGELVRVEFTGDTATLRGFLNRVAGGRLAIVRSVDVEPLEAPASSRAATAPGEWEPRIVRALSRFAVVVEVFEFADQPKEVP